MSAPTRSERAAELLGQIAGNPFDVSVEKFKVFNIAPEGMVQFRVNVRCARFNSYEDAELAGEAIVSALGGRTAL